MEVMSKFWAAVKPQMGKAVAFVVGALASALGAAVSPETLQSLSDFVTKLFS
ncbi:MAG: hypothetical protein ACI4PW_00785 [Alphaproteobacteria bacterium]